MDGLTPVTTSNNWLAVNDVGVVASSLTNEGTISITADISATLQARVEATIGKSESTHFVVPMNHTFVLTKLVTAVGNNDKIQLISYTSIPGLGIPDVRNIITPINESFVDVNYNMPLFGPETANIRIAAS